MPMAAVCPQTGDTSTVWGNWNAVITNTTSGTGTLYLGADQAWANWNATSVVTASFTVTTSWTGWNTAYEETREQREAREARAAEQARLAETARPEREAARVRAEELLAAVLSEEQMAEYRTRRSFTLVSSKGRRWRIRAAGQSGNVDLLPDEGEEREATYCAHPPGGLPDADAHLAQALTLITDEDAFLRVANRHYQRRAAA